MTYNLQPSYPNSDVLETKDRGLVVLYGRRADGVLVPINIDNSGNINLGSAVVLSAEDLRLGAVEIQDNDSNNRADVLKIGDTIDLPPFSGSSDNYRGFLILGQDSNGLAVPLSFDNTGSLRVTTVATSTNSFNQYGAASVPGGGIETALFPPITVTSVQTLLITGLISWGDVDAEYLIKVDGAIVGGGRSSPAVPTLQLDYGNASLKVMGAPLGKTVTIVAKQYTTSAQILKANLRGDII